MHSSLQQGCCRMDLDGYPQMSWIQENPKSAEREKITSRGRAWAKCADTPGKMLAAPRLSPAKEEIVELALLAPGSFFAVETQLAIAQSFERLSLPAQLVVEVALLVPQLLQPSQLSLQPNSVLKSRRFTGEVKMQIGRRSSVFELAHLQAAGLAHARVELDQQMTQARDLLIGGAQPQFLLVLDALPKVQDGLQRKMKGHGINSATPIAL